MSRDSLNCDSFYGTILETDYKSGCCPFIIGGNIKMVLDKLAKILITVAIVFTLVGVGYWLLM